jgi:cysteinyl-tRNA synthetase
MAKKHLGVTFDIHGGGQDLIFPHHENEIAQSGCAHNGARLANYWLHNGFLTINNDKMSKSLGNFFTVRDVLDQSPGEAIRLALLSAHYRQPLDFSLEKLHQAKQTLDRWYGALRAVPTCLTTKAAPHPDVEAALADDLNVPQAIAVIHGLVDELNKMSASLARDTAKKALRASAGALGFLQEDPDDWFKWQPVGAALAEADIAAKIVARQQAKQNKNYAEADRLRTELLAAGITLEDSASGTSWRRS